MKGAKPRMKQEKRAQVVMDPALHRRLKAYAALRGKTVRSLIEDAAREILGEKKKK